MKKIFLILCVILFILVFIFVLYIKFFKLQNKNSGDKIFYDENEGIEIYSPSQNELVRSPLKINGRVSGNDWIAFEAQTGTVKLFDQNGKELAFGILTASQEDWMKKEVEFETILSFNNPETKNGRLVFYNENPSGEPVRDKTFVLPVRFK